VPDKHPENGKRPPAGLSPEELQAEQSQQLPDREAMSTINASFGFPIENLAMPINEAIATNLNTNFSVANAQADQIVIVDQASDAGTN